MDMPYDVDFSQPYGQSLFSNNLKGKRMAQTKYVQIDAYLRWAKVFPENRDTAERARKNGVTHKGVLKFLEKFDGQYMVDVIPATQDDLDKVKAALTDQLYGGNPRYKDIPDGPGTQVQFQLSRKHDDKHVFKDRDTGEDKPVDFGGQPEIVWFNDTKGKNTPYDLETDGFIGNDTLAKVKFSVYMGGSEPSQSDTIRLEKLGIIDHVAYESDGSTGDRF